MTRDVVETFTAWKERGGVQVPVGREVKVDGKESASLAIAWNEVELLSRVPTETFQKEAR